MGYVYLTEEQRNELRAAQTKWIENYKHSISFENNDKPVDLTGFTVDGLLKQECYQALKTFTEKQIKVATIEKFEDKLKVWEV